MEMTMKKDDPFFVRLDGVPRNGRTLVMDLEEEWVAPLLTDAYSASGKGARAEAHIERHGDNLVVKGELELGVVFACSRCGQEVKETIASPVTAIFVPEGAHHVRLNDFENDDDELDDLIGYTGRSFSIEQPFVDAITLALAAYPVCQEGCPGITVPVPETPAQEGQVDPRWGPLAELKKKLNR
jgi:uncharacterized metal-binding protein YceD (DUF177 family)